MLRINPYLPATGLGFGDPLTPAAPIAVAGVAPALKGGTGGEIQPPIEALRLALPLAPGPGGPGLGLGMGHDQALNNLAGLPGAVGKSSGKDRAGLDQGRLPHPRWAAKPHLPLPTKATASRQGAPGPNPAPGQAGTGPLKDAVEAVPIWGQLQAEKTLACEPTPITHPQSGELIESGQKNTPDLTAIAPAIPLVSPRNPRSLLVQRHRPKAKLPSPG